MDVAIRDAMLPDLDEATFFGTLRRLGVSSIEIEVQEDGRTPWIRSAAGSHGLTDDASLARLKRRLSDEGVRACALLVSTDFSSGRPDAQVEWAVVAVHAAHALGAPVVRIDPLSRDKSVTLGAARDHFVRGAENVLKRTERSGVDLGMENHGPFANDPRFLDAVLAALPDPRLGLTLDTGNFYWFGFPLEEVYELVEKYAPVAKHTHLKSINFPPDVAGRRREVGYGYKQYCCALHEGNLDVRRVVRTLRGAGYSRDLCVEDESLFKHSPGGRVDVLRREVDAVRSALAEAGA